MTRMRFYVGTLDKHGNKVSKVQRENIEGFLSSRYGGFTKYETAGAWWDGGRVIEEPSHVYEVVTGLATREMAAERAAFLRDSLGQSSVLYTVEEVSGGFV